MTTPVAATADTSRRRSIWNVSLWTAQVLLAAAFAMTGAIKAVPGLTQDFGGIPVALARFIGVAELTAVVGLILPALTRIRPFLTPLAAAGLVVIMVLATAFHLSRGEVEALPVTLTLGALAAFVAWGRTRKAPIPGR